MNDFVNDGYLQEVNRRFFHPLGLALTLSYDNVSDTYNNMVIQKTNDSLGFYYDLENSDEERLERFNKKFERIESLFNKRSIQRVLKLGDVIEQIPIKE